MRLGSLCSGIGGLELGLERAGIGHTVWHAEIDPHASEVLARHWDVPNLGDFRTSGFPDCDVLVGGFPCQPVSTAGRRAGTEDERWLFDDIVEAVGAMGSPPRLCVFENVRGLLSANGGSAMGRVVHGLASVGFVGRYGLLRAADVGACHRRERVFIVAEHADRGGRRSGGVGRVGRTLGEGRGDSATPATATDPGQDAPAHTTDLGLNGSRRARDGGTGSADGGGPAANPHIEGACRPSQEQVGPLIGRGVADDRLAAAWGPYGPAIERWAGVLGRPAPPPTVDGRLSPAFVEWMQGFPEGWVDGLSRTAALRCLGNAVVPQVAELLGRIILGGEASGVGSDGALLPTPNASDTSRSPTGAKKRMADGRQVCLGTVVALLPTPTAVYGGVG